MIGQLQTQTLMFIYRIENLEQSNEGVYICRASSAYGQAQDTARLTIQGWNHSLQILLQRPGVMKTGWNSRVSFLLHSPAEGDDQRAYLSADCHDWELCGV